MSAMKLKELSPRRRRIELKCSEISWHGDHAGVSIELGRLWRVLRRFFVLVANAIPDERPVTAEKLRRASLHWMRATRMLHTRWHGAPS